MFTLNGGSIAWKISNQEVITLYTIESEYIVAYEVAQEVDWMRKITGDPDVVPCIKKAIKMLCDNTSFIAIARD